MSAEKCNTVKNIACKPCSEYSIALYRIASAPNPLIGAPATALPVHLLLPGFYRPACQCICICVFVYLCICVFVIGGPVCHATTTTATATATSPEPAETTCM